jgi:hypothetical protein
MPFAILPLEYCSQNESKIREINRSIGTLRDLPVDTVRSTGNALAARVAFALDCYRNGVVLRLRLLERGASGEFNKRNFICSVILVRQLIETAAHFISTYMYVSRELEKKPPAFKAVHDKLAKALFGSKLKQLNLIIPAEQILNCIDDTDKFLSHALSKKQTAVRETYDFLSEFVHPNSYGTFLYHGDFSSPTEPVAFHPNGSEATANQMASHIFAAMYVLKLFLYCEKHLGKLAGRGAAQ